MKRRIAFGIVWLLTETALMVWGLSHEIRGVENLIKALAVCAVPLTPLVVLIALEAKDKSDEPKWMRRFRNWAEVVQTAILVWFGWYWCALAWGARGIAAAISRGRDGKGPISERIKRTEATK